MMTTGLILVDKNLTTAEAIAMIALERNNILTACSVCVFITEQKEAFKKALTRMPCLNAITYDVEQPFCDNDELAIGFPVVLHITLDGIVRERCAA